MDALADTGAEMEGVAGLGCFPPHMVVSAPKRLKITGADGINIFGGKTGVWVDVQTPCWTARGTRLVPCRRVCIYIVSIGKRRILGFPFLQRYRLAILPNLPYLVPLELIRIGSWWNHLQYRPDKCSCCTSLQCCPIYGSTQCPEMGGVAAVEALPMSSSHVLCKCERHSDCRVACRDKNKSCHRPTVVKFKQTVQQMNFPEQIRPAMIGTALHCTIREFQLKPLSGAEICHSEVTQTDAVQELTHTPYSFGQGITFDMLSQAQGMLNEVSQTPSGRPIIDFLRLSEWPTMQKRGRPQSAGLDVTAADDRTIGPWNHAVISTSLSAVAPPGTYIRVAPRSGLALKHGLFVGAGVVDADYRGDIGVVLFNHTGVAYCVTTSDRIAQLICEQCVLPTVREVTSMHDISRGAAGFGSTGTSVLTSPSPLPSPFVFSILKYRIMALIAGCML